MSNGHPPQCDPACQKLILDGDLAGSVYALTGERIAVQSGFGNPPSLMKALDAGEASFLVFAEAVVLSTGGEVPALGKGTISNRVTALVAAFTNVCEQIEHHGSLANADDAVVALITAENCAFNFMRAFLEAVGYTGPWPKCLS